MGSNANRKHRRIRDQKSTFLPMFCRSSIKDVKFNAVQIAAAEPSSPRVSCMGQVKRNNRVVTFPAAAAAAAPSSTATNHHKHAKQEKVLFFTKTLLPKHTTMKTAKAAGGRSTGCRSCRTDSEICGKNIRSGVNNNCDLDFVNAAVVVDVSRMDPPLPVVKRVVPPGVGRDEMNLWRRRFKEGKTCILNQFICRITNFKCCKHFDKRL